MSEQADDQQAAVEALTDLGNAVGKTLLDWAQGFQQAMNAFAELVNEPGVKAAIEHYNERMAEINRH